MNFKVRTHVRLVATLSLIAVALLGVVVAANAAGNDSHRLSVLAFHDQMRKLWEDHITWTRLVIVSIAQGLPDTGSTVGRLLQNQVDIGNAIKPFYGDAAGNKLTSLLHDHITIAAEILVAAKAGDNNKLTDALNRWYANANDIAKFLSSANPRNWPLEDIQQMMKTHLDLTLQEATAYLKGDFAGSVSAYEQVHLEILHMADTLSNGIVRQFPHQFNGGVQENNEHGNQ